MLVKIGLSLALAPIAFVICLFAALPIALEAQASPLFVQIRLGRDERPFRLLKLRTMRVSTPSVASHEIAAGHILVTGKLLRRLKFDELPQIWNVLNGTMSFVGPRPGLPNQSELTAARRRHGVFSMTPGITGVSQIQGFDMSLPDRLAETDKAYAAPWSLRRDLSILWATVTGKGSGDAAMSRIV
jgi:O-antigen biosynthesis protein WbqP